MSPLLAVEDLTVTFPRRGGRVKAVSGVSLAVEPGEVVGLVGESGSGKTLTALSILGLVAPPGRIDRGRVLLEGEDLLRLRPARLAGIRGRRVAMVFQEPTTALNPVFTIGFQIAEVVRLHRGLNRREARREAVRLLELVALPDPSRRLGAYPHELSGGQCQRVMIALALAGRPQLLLADEPTAALDVTVQAQILELLATLRRELGLAVILISHDLGVIARCCDRVVVLYCGEVVEEAPAGTLFAAPAHPYTRALLRASPRLGRPAERGRMPSIPGRAAEPGSRPQGCAFHPRCAEAFGPCAGEEPPLYPLAAGHRARCFLHAAAVAPR